MSDRLYGKTAWEFVCGWYTPDQIAYSVKNRHRTPSDTAMPDDVDSVGFAQWLTEQYRLAMAKGIQVAQQDCTARLAEAEARNQSLLETSDALLQTVRGERDEARQLLRDVLRGRRRFMRDTLGEVLFESVKAAAGDV